MTVSLTNKGAALQENALEVMAAIGTATGCSLEEIAALRDQLQDLRGKLNAAAQDC